jgi:hypothetical protein
VIIVGILLAAVAAVIGWLGAALEGGGRKLSVTLALVVLGALAVLGFATRSPWMVAVAGIEVALLVALQVLRRMALPPVRQTTSPELSALVATLATDPNQAFLRFAVYRDGTIQVVAGRHGHVTPELMARYELADGSCPHCFVEHQIRTLADEPEASVAVETYHHGTVGLRTVEVGLHRPAGAGRWSAKTVESRWPPCFDQACEAHQPS